MCFVSSLCGCVWGHQADTLMIFIMNTTQVNGGTLLGHVEGGWTMPACYCKSNIVPNKCNVVAVEG